MKICSQCNSNKDLSDFYKSDKTKDGYRNQCKSCVSNNNKKWRDNNIEKVSIIRDNDSLKTKQKRIENPEYYKEKDRKSRNSRTDEQKLLRKQYTDVYNKEYYNNNKETLIENRREYGKIWRDNNKEHTNEYMKLWKKKYRSNEQNSIKHKISCSIRNSIKRNGFSKKSNTIDILGCSFNEFIEYLESKFEPWMNWNNRGLYNGESNYGWDIDHIIPVSSAETEDDIIRLNYYTNFQPLCSKVNRDIKKNN